LINYLSSPLKPTLKRYFKIFIKQNNISIQRALMYEALENLKLEGRVLDFGGGERSNYSHLISKWILNGTYESANISKKINPTYILGEDGNIPVSKDTFDVILSLNTFEHIFQIKKNLKELKRVLKKGGVFIFSTPFIYRVHGCPDDYIRPTSSWWAQVLNDLEMQDINIKPLVWDPITTAFSICDGILPLSFLFRKIVPIYGLVYTWIKSKSATRYHPESVGMQLANFAQGYIIIAKKKY